MNNKLSEYINILEAEGLVLKVQCKEPEAVRVNMITYDSKAASKGCLFICKGAAFKRQYLEDAVKKGAVCYISETDYALTGVDSVIVSDIRKAMPYIARLHYDIPKDFKTIAITGTKGKTTTAYYMKAVFDEAMSRLLKPQVGFMTTVETFDGKERISSGITTPESFEIYRHFRNAYDSRIRYMIMEFSSQALKYRRVQGIEPDTAIFLNISEDHISPIEHPDFEDYFKSKLKIFEQCRRALICADTQFYERVAKAAKAAERVITFGIDNEADVRGFNIRQQGGRTAFTASVFGKEYEFLLNMRGKFNVENALSVIAAAYEYKLPMEAVQKALAAVYVPGRVEEFESADKNVHVIVDYAHNGFSFRSIIGTARESWPECRIVTVFGCPGGKALNRRRDMGIAAGEMSDFVYLTADDPAKERIEDICRDIGQYLDMTGCEYTVIPDRERAINTAVQKAGEPTVVLILGKGCETTQKTASGSELYASDALVAKDALSKYNKK